MPVLFDAVKFRTYAISGRSKLVYFGLGSILLIGFPVRAIQANEGSHLIFHAADSNLWHRLPQTGELM